MLGPSLGQSSLTRSTYYTESANRSNSRHGVEVQLSGAVKAFASWPPQACFSPWPCLRSHVPRNLRGTTGQVTTCSYNSRLSASWGCWSTNCCHSTVISADQPLTTPRFCSQVPYSRSHTPDYPSDPLQLAQSLADKVGPVTAAGGYCCRRLTSLFSFVWHPVLCTLMHATEVW